MELASTELNKFYIKGKFQDKTIFHVNTIPTSIGTSILQGDTENIIFYKIR